MYNRPCGLEYYPGGSTITCIIQQNQQSSSILPGGKHVACAEAILRETSRCHSESIAGFGFHVARSSIWARHIFNSEAVSQVAFFRVLS